MPKPLWTYEFEVRAHFSTPRHRFQMPVQALIRCSSETPCDFVVLQLYTVGHEMDIDPAGTLKAVAVVGYKQVEFSPLAKMPPKDMKNDWQSVSFTWAAA